MVFIHACSNGFMYPGFLLPPEYSRGDWNFVQGAQNIGKWHLHNSTATCLCHSLWVIRRPHSEQFLMELLSTEELWRLRKLLTVRSVGYLDLLRYCFKESMLLLGFSNLKLQCFEENKQNWIHSTSSWQQFHFQGRISQSHSTEN